MSKYRITGFLALLLAGCVGSATVQERYDEETGTVSYEAPRIPLTFTNRSDLASQESIMMQAQVRERGRAPREAYLVFLNTGSSDLHMERLAIRVETETNMYEWDDVWNHERGSSYFTSVPLGEFARVALPYQELKTLAYSKRMRGTIGGFTFSLTPSQRNPMRALIERIEGGEAPAN